MDISSVVPTIVGGLLALGGGFLGQWWSERRAAEREARERNNEREVWARDLRYQAHVEFINVFNTVFKRLYAWKQNPGDESEPPDNFLTPVIDAMTPMRLVTNEITQLHAIVALEALRTYPSRGGSTYRDVDKALGGYMATVRREFDLQPINHYSSRPRSELAMGDPSTSA